jgi:hypothetical protein
MQLFVLGKSRISQISQHKLNIWIIHFFANSFTTAIWFIQFLVYFLHFWDFLAKISQKIAVVKEVAQIFLECSERLPK